METGQPEESAPTPARDYRSEPRRRGQALEAAIFEATLAELAEVGYQDLTMERVAQRAHTGKTSVYRRWPTRAELVIEAIRHHLPMDPAVPNTGDLRKDLLVLLRRTARLLDGPTGQAIRGLMGETLRDRGLAEDARAGILDAATATYLNVLRRAAARGEARPDALKGHVAAVAPSMLRQHFLVHGAPIPDRVLTDIVDDIMLPLVR